jgi:histidyl-tRNA synthetase
VSQKLAAVKGMNDLLPGEIERWHRVEQVARRVMATFGYGEIRTPILEDTALFVRGVGEETDIVGKEMYTFEDKGGRSLSMRPEGTAPCVRAYIEHAVLNQEPVTHWYYLGPMFRYERMKTGRYRQFWQVGAEAFGPKEPAQDVEVLELAVRIVEGLELKGVSLELNSLGDDVCRPAYQARLVQYFQSHVAELCEDCKQRLERNPLRVLDCKNPGCQAVAKGAPMMVDALCDDCRAHFTSVQAGLDRVGVHYRLNPRIVRGLDYYTRTAFELIADSPALGTASAVGGGGRYDKLVKSLGGADVPAVGFAIGMDRLCLLLQEMGTVVGDRALAFLVSADERAQGEVLALASRLRRDGLRIETDPRGGSVKSQMKRADKSGARFAIVLGERELTQGAVELKPLQGGDARSVPLAELPAALAAIARDDFSKRSKGE